jgi:hypothetical protein
MTGSIKLWQMLKGGLLLLTLMATSGCLHRTGSVDRFLQHPEFNAAATHAPGFTRDVLHALADAERKVW